MATPSATPNSHRLDLLPGLEHGSSVLFVPLARTVPATIWDNTIREATPAWALRNRLTVLGIHHDQVAALNDNVLDDISRRVEDAPLYVLTQDSNGQPSLQHHRGPALGGLDPNSTIEALRRSDVLSLLERPGSLLPSSKLLHYEGPNLSHYTAFLRPGFALRTIDDLDRLAFWLLPYLRGRTHLVVDHWSMLGLGYHMANYASHFDGTSTRPLIQAVSSYDETTESLATRLGLAFPTPTSGGAAFLLSINSSGALAHDIVLPALERAGQTEATVVALAAAPPASSRPVPALATLDDTYARHAEADCPSCTSGRRTILPIEHDTYLLRLTAFSSTAAITAPDTECSTDVVQAYANLGAFSVHRHHADQRHHAFYIDVIPMLGTTRFRERLQTKLAELHDLSPDLIVHPPHPAATQLAQLIADRVGNPDVLAQDERQLALLNRSDRAKIENARQILILDDVVITGTRLEGYRQQFIRLRRDSGINEQVELRCLVAVARARKPTALRGTTDIAHHSADTPTFAAVENLYLPHWDQQQCPWCAELQLLRNLPNDVRQLPHIQQREAHLEGSDGLRTNLFFPWPDGVASNAPIGTTEQEWKEAAAALPHRGDLADSYFDLNPGSVFGEVQDADLMISVAAAVHQLRIKRTADDESRLDEQLRPPISKTLDPDLYLLGRFYEPVLIAAIVRACRPWDLRTTEGDTDLIERIETRLKHLTSSQRLAGEFLVQAALDQLPAVPAMHTLGDPASPERLLAQSLLRQAN